jgi:glycosyltransferase involved in cell wall biosynthesis
MRILILTNSYPSQPDAAEVAAACIRDAALSLAAAGAEVCVLTSDRAGDKKTDPGITVRWFPWSGRDTKQLIDLKPSRPRDLMHLVSLAWNGVRAATETCRSFRPDVCLAAWAIPSGLFALLAKRRTRVPYAVWCLGSDIHTYGRKRLFRPLVRAVLRGADRLYADGFALRDDVRALAARPCEFMATTRRLTVPTGPASPLEAGKTHFLFVGRWETVKGLDVLLDAWRALARTGETTSAVLHVAGAGPQLEAAVRAAERDPALGGSVRPTGWLNVAALAALYRACDCVVIPSRRDSIPVVFSEALGAGRPLIVADVGDMGMLVKRYGLGAVVASEAVGELRDALARFVATPHRTAPEALAAALRLFDPDATARDFLADARALVGASARSVRPARAS